jgi:site-specific recombinase XerD
LTNDDWLNDPTVEHWLKMVNNERTVKNYKWELPKFLAFVNVQPKDIVQQRLEQLTTADVSKRRCWEDKYTEYKHSLENLDLKKNTIKSYLRTVQSFFAYNNVKLVLTRNDTKITPKNREDRVPTEWIPTNEEVRLFYRMAKESRDRAILLSLYQSGFSEVDVANMFIEDFPFYDEKGDWRIPVTEDLYHQRLREKTNILQQTCISREALEEIRIMLQSRGYPKKGYLFISFRNQPLGVRGINDAMKEIAQRAFDGRAKEWLTKHLRDAYMNGLLQAKIPQEVKDSMVGHQRQGARKEYGLTEQTIKAAYDSAFKFLTINGFGSASRKVEELEQKFDLQNKTLTEIITELRTENKQLKEQLAGIQQTQSGIVNSLKSAGKWLPSESGGIQNITKVIKRETNE